MSSSPRSPTSPVDQEPEVPTVPSPEPKRQRLTPIDDAIVHDEPFHQVPPPLTADIPSSSSSSSRVLPPLRYPLEQVLAAFVAKMYREIGNMREAAGEITGLRGNINLTAAELTAIINERVAEALAANPTGGQNNNQQAKHASGTLEGPALTWGNQQAQMLTLEMANALTWEEFKNMLKEEYCPRDEVQKLEAELWNLKMEGSEIEAYTTRSHELETLCPQNCDPNV
ncbi:hypothetical protein L1987_46389 [Smallanthus sonchifolius]|uniref:Uncharacterized protein n=1 Tax=Smallanthus sonchifolius TaxID=185202 RepID=A0ACB9FZJ3_9ASTR|nr:hypothetical protein L1987_46389 [Smallanthus sonchifolius]